MKNFIPDYHHIVQAANNIEAERLPLYEHNISDKIMEKILNVQFSELIHGDQNEIDEYFKYYCHFFRKWDMIPFPLNAVLEKLCREADV